MVRNLTINTDYLDLSYWEPKPPALTDHYLYSKFYKYEKNNHGTKHIISGDNTYGVDGGNNKKVLLSCCSDLFPTSFLSFFICRKYGESIIFQDPFKIDNIIELTNCVEIKIFDLLVDYKLMIEESKIKMTSKSSSSSSTTDITSTDCEDLYEKMCGAILLEECQEFEKLLKNPLIGSIIHKKDNQGRSLLTLSCMVDKPKIATILVKKGLSIDDRDNSGRNALYWAVKCDSIKTIKCIFNQLSVTEDFILSKDDQGITSLHVAATKSSSKILRLLLNSLTNKDENLLKKIFDCYNRIPLHYAAASGSLECVEEFMDESLSLPISTRDMYGNTPLMLACGNKCASDVIRYLSSKKSISATSRNCFGMSPLHIAVLANNIDGVKILLEECKISTEIYDEDARTPLHYAAQNGRVEIVEVLLKNGARYNACDEYHATPAHYAAEMSWPIVDLLITKNDYSYCGMTDKEGRTPFMWAVISENEEIVCKMLKNYDIPRHGKDNHKYTALHLATFTGNSKICKTLLQYGWLVTAEDKAGATPLHIAAGKGFTNIVQIFCTSDDVIDKVDTNLRTPLFYAALGGQAHTLNVMISDLGFNMNVEDILDRTVLHAAVYCGFVACVKRLIDHGVNVNAIDRDEETPLHVACSRGKENVAYLLIKSGAVINAYSRVKETTPLTYAINNNQVELIEFLRERNAVTGEEIRNIAACIITRAFRRYVGRKRAIKLKMTSGDVVQFTEQSSISSGLFFAHQLTSKNSSIPVTNGSLNSPPYIRTPIRNLRSSQSIDSEPIYVDGTLLDIVDY